VLQGTRLRGAVLFLRSLDVPLRCCAALVVTAGVLIVSTPASPGETSLKLKQSPQHASGAAPLDKELDFTDRNDTAVMEGTVSRGVPHRYVVAARRGQSLEATLHSKEGARFDLYEPGSSLTVLSSGFVVQGPRLGSTEGPKLNAALPADGKYLLLVRPLGERASYTLELTVQRGAGLSARWSGKIVWLVLLIAIVVIAVLLLRRKRRRRLFRSDLNRL
jgi:hypothetical protein